MHEETVNPSVKALYRYPVKGLTPQPLDRVALEIGETFPLDRIYAIENGSRRFDPDRPQHLPKINFLMLMRNERLAALDCDFEAETHTLTIRRGGRRVARGRLDTWLGRSVVEQFFSAYCADELKGPPIIVHAPGHSFSDKAQKCVHVVNLATVRELERSVGRPVDPLRFRANIYVRGVKPWAEFDWEGKEMRIGGASLLCIDRTARCDATNVDPKTGARDLSIPSHLQRTLGHSRLGVYAVVTAAGELKPGDSIRVEG